MVDLAELAAAHESIQAAKAGDLEPMIARLQRLTPDEADWLAAELRGEHRAGRGRKKLRQTKGEHLPLKGLFKDNNDIDLAAWDAFNFITRVEGQGEVEARRQVANALGETPKNVSHRLSRLSRHLSAGGTRAEYRTADERDVIRAAELISEAFARHGLGTDPGLRFPLLLALHRK